MGRGGKACGGGGGYRWSLCRFHVGVLFLSITRVFKVHLKEAVWGLYLYIIVQMKGISISLSYVMNNFIVIQNNNIEILSIHMEGAVRVSQLWFI